MGRPTFDYHDACLFEGIIHLLHEAGRLDDALALLDERSSEFVEEHSSWLSSNRIWLLGEAGRHEEALAYAGTLPPAMYGLTVSKVWILEEMGALRRLSPCCGRTPNCGRRKWPSCSSGMAAPLKPSPECPPSPNSTRQGGGVTRPCRPTVAPTTLPSKRPSQLDRPRA
ncbi:hypothetical protein GCM10010254_57230 [Streptomyces chromofuscus]|nr:hypothetical protein GCM10010254_57230 [Streptomyces chromofuscus]